MQKIIILTAFHIFFSTCFVQAADTELESRIRIIVKNQIVARLYEISQDKNQMCSMTTFANYLDKELAFSNLTFGFFKESFDFFSPAKIEIFKLQVKKQCCLMTGKSFKN